MKFYTVEKLSPKLSLTPEGFLLCEGVPIARTGEMDYVEGETPIPTGPDGVVKISRDDAAVFDPKFVLSLAGKPVVNDHPPMDVDVKPENWREYAMGTVLNPRRGTGTSSDFLIADLLVYDRDAIAEIQAGKREVSCGYEAEYEELSPGRGRQYDLLGNHVALVEAGRCGHRCAIADHSRHSTGDTAMPVPKSKVKRAMDRIRKAFKAKDEGELEESLEDAASMMEDPPAEDAGGADPDATHLHIHGAEDSPRRMSDEDIEGRFGAIESRLDEIHDAISGLAAGGAGAALNGDADPSGAGLEVISDAELEEEVPEGTKDAARRARDSKYFADTFQETLALAEILAPGLRLPAYDAAAAPKKTYDAVCNLRRQALDLAYNRPETRGIIDDLNAGKPLALSGMACTQVRTLFRAAASMKKALNASSSHDSATRSIHRQDASKKVRTPADLNKMFAEHYGKK